MSDIYTPANSIWPNGVKRDSEDYAIFYPLGTNKINVPTSASTWPVGDKLISPFVYQGNKVVGFCDTKAMTVSGNTSTSMPYTYIKADFSSIRKGLLKVSAPNATFTEFKWNPLSKYSGCTTVDEIKAVDSNYAGNDIINNTWSESLSDLKDGTKLFLSNFGLYYFYADLNSLENANNMFASSQFLSEFKGNLNSLKDGTGMFYNCIRLSVFETDNLNSLENGYYMFGGTFGSLLYGTFSYDMPNLKSAVNMFRNDKYLEIFTSDLSSLTNGNGMFAGCSGLNQINTNLSSLTNGENMFNGCSSLNQINTNLSSLTNGGGMFASCANLIEFNIDLPNLVNGDCMFDSSNLQHFNSSLSSLTSGFTMFFCCYLSSQSVKNILSTINTFDEITEERYIDLDVGCEWGDDEIDFANECGFADIYEIIDAFENKGWMSTITCVGRPESTYSLKRRATVDKPIYVKLIEVADDEYYNYTSQDGIKKYRLHRFHYSNISKDDYTQFNSLEEAIETLNIKPIERN